MLKFALASALVATAAPVLAQGGVAGLKPATPADIVSAASSCIAAVGPTGTDQAVLLAQGWTKATMTRNGKAVEPPLGIYGRKSGNVVLMIGPNGKTGGLCNVVARVERIETASAVASSLSTQLNSKPAKTEPGSVYWFRGSKIVQLATTGDRAKPSVRISVMQMSEKPK